MNFAFVELKRWWFPQGKDDITGEPLIQHDDDKPEALMARLRQYKDVAKPVMDLYKSVHMFILWSVCKLYTVIFFSFIFSHRYACTHTNIQG